MSEIEVEAGQSINKPNDPTKADNIFDGWLKDEKLTQAVPWPLKLDEDLTINAKWTENRDYFLAARDNTINSDQFEYDFNLKVNISYGAIAGPSAIIDGNVKYNESSTNSYYKKKILQVYFYLMEQIKI